MKRIKVLLGLGVLLLPSLFLLAQPPRGGRGFRGPLQVESKTRLLQMVDVQREVGIEENQLKDLDESFRRLDEVTRDQMADFNPGEWMGLTPEERTPRFDALRKKMTEAIQKVDDASDKVLRPNQRKRLGELLAQREGIISLLRPEFSSAVDLTADQKKGLMDLQRKLMEPPMPPPDFGGPPDFEQWQRDQQQAEANVMKSLSDEQRKAWTAVQAKHLPFQNPNLPVDLALVLVQVVLEALDLALEVLDFRVAPVDLVLVQAALAGHGWWRAAFGGKVRQGW